MTTPSDPEQGVVASGSEEHRLHPLSWLFVLIQQLKSFALPLLLLLITGSGNTHELWGLVGVGGLVLYSLVRYATFRYRVEREGLVIRSGVFQRTVRHIPFERIHNVVLHQSLLHRLFGVAEIQLESAGGAKPEGRMSVLSLAAAHMLDTQIRSRSAELPVQAEAAEESGEVRLALDTPEVIRLGLISNRGLIVVAAGLGALSSAGQGLVESLMQTLRIEQLIDGMMGWGESQLPGYTGMLLAGVMLFAMAVVVLRVLSVALALLQFHGFELREQGQRLRVQRGLLTRLRSSLPRHRIQAWSLHESLLHRWFGRQSLRVDSIAQEASNDHRSVRDLVPVATPAVMMDLLCHLLPTGQWPLTHWKPLHVRAWRRQFLLPAVAVLVLAAALVAGFGLPGLLVLILLPLVLLRAKVWAAHAAYAEQGGLIAVREGWLDKRWRFADVRKLQALRVSQSPFDRRHGMATLHLDTAGASPLEPPLRIRYLPEAEARALHARLAAAMEGVTPSRSPV